MAEVISQRQRAIGQRLKRAAEEVNLSAYEIAQLMGCEHTTVYRWWNGERTPRGEGLEAYARIVGKHPDWFHQTAQKEADAEVMSLAEQIAADRFVELFRRAERGKSLLEAADETVIGSLLEDEDRLLVQEQEDSLRQSLLNLTNGEFYEWPAARREKILRELFEQTARP